MRSNTHDTCSRNRRHKSTLISGPVFGAGFCARRLDGLEGKSQAKINRAKSDVDDQFAVVAANIVAGVETKDKLKRNKS